MASMEFKNNARSTVADNPLAQSATTLNVATGEGANFPSSFPFKIDLWDAITYPNPGDDSGMEIVKCTGRTADALTIVRAQEGTADVAHSLGERVAMLITAGHFNDATTGIVTKLDTIETNAKDNPQMIVAASDSDTTAGADYVCDGTDDEVQILAAIAALPATGGEVLLLDGTFEIDSNSVIITKSNIAIRGSGRSTVLNTTTKDVIIVGNDSDSVSGFSVSNLKITITGLYHAVKLFKNVTYSEISYIYVDGGYHGIFLDSGGNNYIKISNCTLFNSTGASIEIDPPVSKYITINNCFIEGAMAEGIYLGAVENTTVNGCQVRNGPNWGIELVSGCKNVIASNNILSTDVHGIAINGTAGVITHCVISDNVIYNCGSNSIDLKYADDCIISGNSILASSQTTDDTYFGIEMDNGNNNIIFGNTIRKGAEANKSAHGINITANAALTVLHGNDLFESGDTGAIADAGTNTRKRNNILNSGAWSALSDITAESFSSDVAHATTDQDAGKAFTISSFPEHAQITAIRVRADWTAGQQANTGSALVNNGSGILPGGTTIAYDNAVADFAADDYIWVDDECFSVSADSGTALTVAGGKKGTQQAFHDDNATIVKANHGVRLVLFKDANRNYSEKIIDLSTIMTYKGVTDAAITATDEYFGLTADIQNLGHNDFLIIEDTIDEICRVQNVNHDTVSATYDYTIFVQDDLAAHDITKDVKKLMWYYLTTPWNSGTTLYGTVLIDEKITGTVNVKVEVFTDSYT